MIINLIGVYFEAFEIQFGIKLQQNNLYLLLFSQRDKISELSFRQQ